MHIYSLKAEISAILAQVDEAGGELTDEQLARIDALGATTEETVNNLFRVIRHAKACEQAVRTELHYMSKRASMWGAVEGRCREHLKGLLHQLKVSSYETGICRPTICKGPPKVQVDDGFNLSSLKGTVYAHLIEESVRLLASEVKAANTRGEALPEGVRVVEGEPYLRL